MSNESLMEVASGIPHGNGGRKRQGKSDAFDREWHFLGMTHHFTCQPIYNIGKNRIGITKSRLTRGTRKL